MVQFRLRRAKETFKDGEILIAKNRWNSVANRMYYACFYSISAYFAQKEIRATTHSGLKLIFNNELVKSGKISASQGKVFNYLFGLRQEADYGDFYSINEDDIVPIISDIKSLIDVMEKLVIRGED